MTDRDASRGRTLCAASAQLYGIGENVQHDQSRVTIREHSERAEDGRRQEGNVRERVGEVEDLQTGLDTGRR